MGIGDEPYKLFFVLLKAKKHRENMAVLLTDNGDTLVDEGEILQEVARFYGQLFLSSRFDKATRLARREILQFMTNRVTQAQWEEMERPPTKKELRKIMSNCHEGSHLV